MRMDKFIEQLQEQHDPETELVGVIWLKEDVIWRASDRGLTVSDEEASEVLEALANNHDACIGINWDIIDYHLDDL